MDRMRIQKEKKTKQLKHLKNCYSQEKHNLKVYREKRQIASKRYQKCTKALKHQRKVAALHKTKFSRRRYTKSVQKKSKLVKKHRKLYRRSISRKVKQIKRVKRIEKRCFGLYAHLKSVSLKTRRQKELTLSKLKSLQKFKTQEKAWKKIQTQKLRKYRSVQRDVARKELDALTKRYKEKESKEKFEVQTRQKNILKDIETLKEQVGKSVEVENKARKIYNDVEVVYKRYRASFINEKKKIKERK